MLLTNAIKGIHILYLTIIFCVVGLAVSILVDEFHGKFDPKKENTKPKYNIYVDIIMHFYILSIMIYASIYVFTEIPFPLNGVYNYDSAILNANTVTILFPVVIMFYQFNLKDKMSYVIDRWELNKTIPK